MSDYLEQLERLSNLFERGALSKEEFEQEKLRLRDAARTQPEVATPQLILTPTRIRVGLVVLPILAGLIAGIVVLSDYQRQPAWLSRSTPEAQESTATEKPTLSTAISFVSATTCAPSEGFKGLLDDISRAAFANSQDTESLVHVVGVQNPLEARGSVSNVGGSEARVASLPLKGDWQGLHVTELRTTRWADGLASSFQIRFSEFPDQAATVLRQLGLNLPRVGTVESRDGVYVAWEVTDSGSALTCIAGAKTDNAAETISPDA